MKVIPIEQSLYLHQVSNHSQFKDLLLKQIEETSYETISNKEESISKTDYNIKETQREWVKTFTSNTQETLQQILNTLQFQSANFPSVWFQQYTTNDYHDFHHHPMSNYSGIYYLELSDNTYTQILINNKITDIEVSEGDILILPSHIVHRCPKVKGNTRRTIISFNFDTHKFTIAK